MSQPAETLPIKAYEQQARFFKDVHLDALLVGAMSPAIPVLLKSELTHEQEIQWMEYKAAIMTDQFPEQDLRFRVIERKAFLSELKDKSPEEIENIRIAWQHEGRLALTTDGRLEALAAGLALYLGFTDKIILTGGRNSPTFVNEKTTKVPQILRDNWPSVAELMADVIERRFLRMMFKRDNPKGKLIEEYTALMGKAPSGARLPFRDYCEQRYFAYRNAKIQIEDQWLKEDGFGSINMIENVVLANEQSPGLKNIGVLHFDYILPRFTLTTARFLGTPEPRLSVSMEQLLWKRARLRKHIRYASHLQDLPLYDTYQRIIDWQTDPGVNPSLEGAIKNEWRWLRATAEAEYIGYWIGYLALVSDVPTMQRIFDFLKSDPAWENAARAIMNEALDGTTLFYEDFANKKVSKWAKGRLDLFKSLIAAWYGRGSRREEHLPPE